jgi:hypothetical protein
VHDYPTHGFTIDQEGGHHTQFGIAERRSAKRRQGAEELILTIDRRDRESR